MLPDFDYGPRASENRFWILVPERKTDVKGEFFEIALCRIREREREGCRETQRERERYKYIHIQHKNNTV